MQGRNLVHNQERPPFSSLLPISLLRSLELSMVRLSITFLKYGNNSKSSKQLTDVIEYTF